ncbi:unnamed protein product [Arabis nemorensis]|uniref:Uncharacterized protein n=1 Tax=Arabis nemorensis TaxID=586526 RepID=A0A565BBK5_9BRAS|nr:unnamed protein product [Arabis nemorensis]
MSDGKRKKSVSGGAPAQTFSDDRTSSHSELEEASTPVGKRVVIKSADMKDDMQKEAIDILLSYSLSVYRACSPICCVCSSNLGIP